MKFPKSLNILGRKFSVTYSPFLDLGQGPESNVYGATQPVERAIYISTGVHKDEHALVSTLIHEALHAAFHVSGASVFQTENEEEACVTMLTHFIEELVPQISKIYQETPAKKRVKE
jgi:hypothetical protein